MKIKNLLSRLDEESFQNILGAEVIGTLNVLGTEYIYTENLIKTLSNSFSNSELIENQTSRNSLVDVLTTAEIEEMSHMFKLNVKADVYEQIKALNFKTYRLQYYAFFEEELEEEVVNPDWETEQICFPTYPLYIYQRDVLNEVKIKLSTEKNRVLLHMPTGSGKTRTAITYICQFLIENEDTNVVWFANTKELLDQAYSEFLKAWCSLGNREIKAIKFWDKSSIDLSTIKGSFIVAGLDKTYQSLMKSIGKLSIFANNCSLVVMDEAHMAIAPTYKLLLENMIANNASLIGLSATPGRTWNDPEEDKKLANFFYSQKAKLKIKGYENPVDFLTKEGYIAKVKNTTLLHSSGISLTPQDLQYLRDKYVLSPGVLKTISEDRLRNMAIISKIRELVKIHKRIILFAITKSHAEVLNSILVALGINSNVVTSETDPNERKKIISKFKLPVNELNESLVLCNFGILTTGFDAPTTSCAIIARPTDSLVLYSQMVGRAIRGRKSGGNDEAEIVTVIDEKLPGFKEVAEAFINWEDVWE